MALSGSRILMLVYLDDALHIPVMNPLGQETAQGRLCREDSDYKRGLWALPTTASFNRFYPPCPPGQEYYVKEFEGKFVQQELSVLVIINGIHLASAHSTNPQYIGQIPFCLIHLVILSLGTPNSFVQPHISIDSNHSATVSSSVG